MRTRWTFLSILWFSISIILASCGGSEPAFIDEKPQKRTKYYTSAFPQRDISKELTKAKNAVLRIVSTGFYRSYSFNRFVTLSDIKTNNISKIASRRTNFEESTAGSSILLENIRDKHLLITCQHVVSFPDTVITYYDSENIPPETYIQSISIKQRQTNLIFKSNRLKSFEILATDSRSDLALLSASFDDQPQETEESLDMPIGENDRLQLGTFIYIIGFPKGYNIVTRGVVGDAGSQHDRFFVMDALFNPGVSGGLIIASRDNYRSFEWVGMARSASVDREDYLVPSPTLEDFGNTIEPYQDTVYVQQKNRISYGITQAVPMNRIRSFLSKHKDVIRKNGFTPPVD